MKSSVRQTIRRTGRPRDGDTHSIPTVVAKYGLARRASSAQLRQNTHEPGVRSEGPASAGPAARICRTIRRRVSARGARADHESVIGIFGDLPPEIFLVAERHDVVPGLLERRVLRRGFGIDLVRGLVGRLHDGRRERAQLRAAREQAPQRRRVARVVAALLLDIGEAGRCPHDRLIGLRQLVPLAAVDHQMVGGAAFPPARIVVVLRDLVEAELLVVVGTDPFGRVDRALLQRRIDVAAADLLRHAAELRQHLAGEPADAEFQALEVGDGPDLAAEPTAHLAARIAGDEGDAVVLGGELVHQLAAVGGVEPGILLACVEAERHRAEQREGRILADVVVGRGMAGLDGAVGHRVERLQRRDDLAAGEDLDLELAVGRFRDVLGDRHARAPQRVERFWPARGQAPFDGGRRLRDRGLRDRGGCDAHGRGLNELTAFHAISPSPTRAGSVRADSPSASSPRRYPAPWRGTHAKSRGPMRLRPREPRRFSTGRALVDSGLARNRPEEETMPNDSNEHRVAGTSPSEREGGLDRRALLAGAGSAVVAGIGAPAPAASAAVAAAPATYRRIDAHTHFSSLKVLDALEKAEGKPFVLGGMYRAKPALSDAAARLALPAHNEVDPHGLVPGPWLEAFPRVVHDRALAPQFARMVNDEIAAVVSAHPKRFNGVALIASVDPDAMVAELHRAVKELGFVGAYLPVGPTAKRLDHPDFEPLYRAIVDLDVMLWLHPSRPPLPEYVDEKTSMYQEWLQMGWPYDTTSAMYRIVFSGVFARHPGIRIITHHHGGFIPYYASRMIGSWLRAEAAGT